MMTVERLLFLQDMDRDSRAAYLRGYRDAKEKSLLDDGYTIVTRVHRKETNNA